MLKEVNRMITGDNEIGEHIVTAIAAAEKARFFGTADALRLLLSSIEADVLIRSKSVAGAEDRQENPLRAER